MSIFRYVTDAGNLLLVSLFVHYTIVFQMKYDKII